MMWSWRGGVMAKGVFSFLIANILVLGLVKLQSCTHSADCWLIHYHSSPSSSSSSSKTTADISNVSSKEGSTSFLEKVFNLRFAVAQNRNDSSMPWLFLITPTVVTGRLTGKADLTRLSHTLQLVPKIMWIVVEDANYTSDKLGRLLRRSGLHFIHLAVGKNLPGFVKLKGKGMTQRNLGLSWLRSHYSNRTDVQGVVYFMDDDNTYDLRLFNNIRQVKRIGVWPVGIAGGQHLEAPKVNAQNKVIGWTSTYAPRRKFAMDMAGFAVNFNVLRNNSVEFPTRCNIGLFEDCFLRELKINDTAYFQLSDLEPFGVRFSPNEVKEVFVWHTQTKKPKAVGKNSGFEI